MEGKLSSVQDVAFESVGGHAGGLSLATFQKRLSSKLLEFVLGWNVGCHVGNSDFPLPC